MNDLVQKFKFENTNVEIIIVNGKPLFNPRHIGECLDMADSTVFEHITNMSTVQAVKLTNSMFPYDSGLTIVRKFHTRGETFLTEMGLYKLILKSRKPEAEKFQDWVCNEVLPSIRKHGMYATPQTIEDMIANPANTIKLLEALQKEQENTKKEKEKTRLEKEKTKLEKEAKEEAIRTKALIGSKREATAMNTASTAVKKVKKLEVALDVSREYASTKRVTIAANYSDSEVHRPLGTYCKKHNIATKIIEDNSFDFVKSYPAYAWKGVYDIDIQDFLNVNERTEIKRIMVRKCLAKIPKTAFQRIAYVELEKKNLLNLFITFLVLNITKKNKLSNDNFKILIEEFFQNIKR